MKTPDDAQRIGGRTAAIVCLGVLIVFQAIVFFVGPHDDFAMEGRAYMLTQLDPVPVTAAIVLFVTMFFLGRVAGRRIIIEGRSPVRVGVLLGIFTAGIVLLYIVSFSLLLGVGMVNWEQMAVVLILLVGIIWLVTAWRINARRRGSHPSTQAQ
jgi:hypothetical protein